MYLAHTSGSQLGLIWAGLGGSDLALYHVSNGPQISSPPTKVTSRKVLGAKAQAPLSKCFSSLGSLMTTNIKLSKQVPTLTLKVEGREFSQPLSGRN